MVPAPSDATATMPLSQDEQNSSIIQQGVKPKELHSGNVVLLDGRKLDFQVSKNAEGEILFNLVTDAIGLIEKDYFSLAFYENGSVRKWLYKNKKIQKQVKDLPWDFSLEVKFYTPDPSQLADDFTRHLLTLQLRTDIYNGKLPASLVNQAHLGSLIAQAELGDYSPEKTYGQSLRALNIVPNMSDELESKIIQLYKDQKGKTPPEAELSFLMACRELTLYGMVMFSAKHNGKPVRVGINSAGISVFQEHLRQNYVVWQGMHQLEYQRKSFTIKLKHGEKEGKSSLTFKLDTEPLAKLCWRTAVEHHTFFRLMQPEDKTNKGGFFQLGSGRFRPEGRTHFQTKMASQMFDGTPTAGPQISSAQIVSRSSENLPAANQGSSPVHYADDKSMEGSSPQKRYTITSHMETNSPRTSTLDRSLEFSSKDKKSNKSSKQVSASSSSSDSEVEVEERHAVQNEKNSGRTPTNESSMRLDGTNDQPSAGPYSPANDLDHGPVIRSERVENVYRITGAGLPPQVDPNDPKNEELPRVRLIARKLEIEQQESGPMYQKASPAKSFAWPNVRELRRYFSHMKVIDGASSLSRRLRRSHRSVYKCESETAPPHTTLQSWHETETSPEQIVTEIDEHGNVIKKTIKTSHETHTIQKQTYQTFSVGNDANEPNGTSNSIENALETIQSINSSIPTAASHAQTRVLVYGKDGEQLETSDVQYDENQVVSSKVVTTGNRTIETITYKTVKDGVVSTNVEHRVTIQGPEVDHEAELRKAIIEATGLNPRYEVQRVEVKQERLA